MSGKHGSRGTIKQTVFTVSNVRYRRCYFIIALFIQNSHLAILPGLCMPRSLFILIQKAALEAVTLAVNFTFP